MDSTCRGNFTDYCASLRGGGGNTIPYTYGAEGST